MAEIVNLNRARKDKARAERKAKAAENRVRFGRSKSEKTAGTEQAAKAKRDHAGHRLEPDGE